MKVDWAIGSIASHIHLGTRWRSVVNFRPQQYF